MFNDIKHACILEHQHHLRSTYLEGERPTYKSSESGDHFRHLVYEILLARLNGLKAYIDNTRSDLRSKVDRAKYTKIQLKVHVNMLRQLEVRANAYSLALVNFNMLSVKELSDLDIMSNRDFVWIAAELYGVRWRKIYSKLWDLSFVDQPELAYFRRDHKVVTKVLKILREELVIIDGDKSWAKVKITGL
jgi:hypothetical protein